VRKVPVRLGAGNSYEIEIGAGALGAVGQTARRVLPANARRIALISNQRVFELYGARVEESLRESGFQVAHWLMGDGERHKSLRTLGARSSFFPRADWSAAMES